MIKAIVGEVDLSPDGENVNVIVNWTDEDGIGLQEKPSVFQIGIEEAKAGNISEVIRQRAIQIKEERIKKAELEAKAVEFAATALIDLKADLEDRAFDCTDDQPVKLDFTKEQIEAKTKKAVDLDSAPVSPRK